MGRTKKAEPEQRVRTFDEAFAEHRLTPTERAELVYRLAAIRARRTIEKLLLEPQANFTSHGTGILRERPTTTEHEK